MSVVNGQIANQTTFNNAFMSRTSSTTSTVAQVALNNPEVESGANVSNAQRAINETFDAVGITGVNDATRKVYSSNNVVADGDSRKVAIGKLDAEFNETTGHDHSSIGGGKPISANNLADFNKLIAVQQTIFYTTGLASEDDVTTPMAGKIPDGDDVTEGVLTDPSLNKVWIMDNVMKETIEDALGNTVYGRITESAGDWKISYFTLVEGVETAYTFTVNYDIIAIFREVVTYANRPTISPDVFNFQSLDVTGDIADASETQRGVVSLNAQNFAGIKMFMDMMAFFHDEEDMSGGGDRITINTPYIYLTSNVSVEIAEMVAVPGQALMKFIKNDTGGPVEFFHMTNADGPPSPNVQYQFWLPEETNFILEDQSVAQFVYDPINNRWNLSSGGGAGGSPAIIDGFTPTPALEIAAATGVDFIDTVAMEQVYKITGDIAGENVVVSANLINPHTKPGAKLRLFGASDSDIVVLTDAAGNGVKLLKGNWYAYDYYTIDFVFDGTIWVETGRNA